MEERVFSSFFDHPDEADRFIDPARSPWAQSALEISEASAPLGETLWQEALLHRLGPADPAQLLSEFPLSSREGAILMGLAESLGRLPDAQSRGELAARLLAQGDFSKGESMAAKALSAAANLLSKDSFLSSLARKGAGAGALSAISSLAERFCAAQSPKDFKKLIAPGSLFSFDMLGEAAQTPGEAARYFELYEEALHALPDGTHESAFLNQGLSVKLSALHERFDAWRSDEAIAIATERCARLALSAKKKNLLFTIDAEESERLELSLAVCVNLSRDPNLFGWDGLGWAIQAYLRCAGAAARVSLALAQERQAHGPLALRLVKGAYWDHEIRSAQKQGLPFAVFPKKALTDRSWLSLAGAFLGAPGVQASLATHHPLSAAGALKFAERIKPQRFEIQLLRGMGEGLGKALRARGVQTRQYAPTGLFRELLPYLARRLLENGTNGAIALALPESPGLKARALLNPFSDAALELGTQPVSFERLHEPQRANSHGFPLTHSAKARAEILAFFQEPIAPSSFLFAPASFFPSPQDSSLLLPAPGIAKAPSFFSQSAIGQERLGTLGAQGRSELLSKAGNLFMARALEGARWICRETGKRIPDALNEMREAADFCFFHAQETKRLFSGSERLPGPLGEENRLWLAPKGPALCISPWNFPVAILIGQATSALGAGCPILVKPSERTPSSAAFALSVLSQAGFPPEAVELTWADAQGIQGALLHEALEIVAFTGSTQTAKAIERALASRDGRIISLIAETGGFNALIADETAHIETLARDALESAINMSAQRCSSLRVLFVERRIFRPVMDKLSQMLRSCRAGRADVSFSPDFGPLIHESSAKKALDQTQKALALGAREIARAPMNPECSAPAWFAPRILEAQTPEEILTEEIFAPVLQCCPYDAKDNGEERLLTLLNRSGFGLTIGLHTRDPVRSRAFARQARSGNLYLNRNLIGAVVGAQPFGGAGLSGTGPKIGGSRHMEAFCHERASSNAMHSIGGSPGAFLGEADFDLMRFHPDS